jgi:serine/threonine protein kinase
MADSIHYKVKKMLCKTRLQRKTDRIQFLQPNEIHIHGMLGVGAFSQVTCVTNLRDKKRYACKHLQPKLLHDPKGFLTAATELAYEAHLLSSLHHPHIVQVHGWAANGIASFEQGQHDSFFLLLDLLEETLDQRIDKWKVMHNENPKLEKLTVLYQIASALEYVHSKGICFRDLKPQNIGFLDGQVKLFDFGLSRELPLLDLSQRFKMSGKVGTIRYMAPEVCLYQPYNVQCDIYSWSMVAYEILTQTRPFEGFTPELYCALVCRQGLRPTDPAAQHAAGNAGVHRSPFAHPIPEEWCVLLKRAWQTAPEHRVSLRSIQQQLQLFKQKEMLLLEQRELHQQQQQQHGMRLWLQQRQQTPVLPPPPPPPLPEVSPDFGNASLPNFRLYAAAQGLSPHLNSSQYNRFSHSMGDIIILDDDSYNRCDPQHNPEFMALKGDNSEDSVSSVTGGGGGTPTFMKRKKRRGYNRSNSARVPLPPATITTTTSLPHLSSFRRRHSSQDLDEYLQGQQDYEAISGNHDDVCVDDGTTFKRRRSADCIELKSQINSFFFNNDESAMNRSIASAATTSPHFISRKSHQSSSSRRAQHQHHQLPPLRGKTMPQLQQSAAASNRAQQQQQRNFMAMSSSSATDSTVLTMSESCDDTLWMN